ncbi:MAG: hypothetical protein ACK4TL_13665 [Hyphomicrobiaceae bacterium]
MSERPTHTRPPRAAAEYGRGRGEDARDVSAGAHPSARHQSIADRAANFRRGAPFLVARATLYGPEPRDPAAPAPVGAGGPPRRLLPAALTLLGVVVVAGLAASIIVVRNADVVRDEVGTRRPERVSDGVPASGETRESAGAPPNASTVPYDLTRRPNDVIVGAWRPGVVDEAQQTPSEPRASVPRRRPLPRRLTAAPPEVPPEPVTRPVVTGSPRYDAPEPKRRFADGEVAHGAEARLAERSGAGAAAAGAPPATSEAVPAGDPERPGTSVVARVGRASETPTLPEPTVEVPLELALPLRRPDPAMLEDPDEAARARSSRSRRARLVRLQRALRREQRRAMKNDPAEVLRSREATFGDWFEGTQRYRP